MVSPKVIIGAIAVLLVTTVTSFPAPPGPLWTTFHNVTIFTPTANYTTPRVLYARTALIGNTLLATWENYSPEPPLVYFPIFKSVDGGKHWTHIANVTDKVNGWGLRYQPMLYVLPERIGKYPAGTLMLAGNSIPTDLSQTRIDVYASLDEGYTWEFVSHVAQGGAANTTDGVPAIWEPFLMAYQNKLICYYSDQRDPSYGQKLVHQTTTDLVSWTGVVNDVTSARYTDRPGMFTVTHLPNGNYMATYEFGGGATVNNTNIYEFPVYYKINANPLNFGNSTGYPIVTQDGAQPLGSPYIVWSPVGGRNGTIVVSSGCCSPVYTNKKLGDVNSWYSLETDARVSYSRSLRVLPDPTKLLITGAGLLPPSNNTYVSADVIEI